MKISSVSKKVLASALSAAMVVAFSPAVALGATNTGGNAWYGEEAVGHNLDNGVVTKAPTCSAEGTMTYTCADGDGFVVVAPIEATGKHTYSIDTDYEAAGFEDGVKWDDFDKDSIEFALKCAGGEDTIVVKNGNPAGAKVTVTKSGTGATFGAEGKVTYTATLEYNKQTITATTDDEQAAWSTKNLTATAIDSGADNIFTNGYTIARIKLANADAKTATLTAAATSKVAVPASHIADGKTTYTAEFDLPEGVVFGKGTHVTGDLSTESSDTYSAVDAAAVYTALDGDPAVESPVVKVQGGKLIVKATVADIDANTDHLGIDKPGNTDVATFATDAEGDETYTLKSSADKKLVEVTYNGKGSMEAGTATDKGMWTIKKYCADGDEKVAVEETLAKASVASCVKKVSSVWKKTTKYTLAYDGGKYEFSVVNDDATATAAAHTYVAGETAWSFDGDGYTATTVYTCPVDGDYYTVELKSDKTAAITHNGNPLADGDLFYGVTIAAGVADNCKAATHAAKGAVAYELTLKAGNSGSASAFATAVEALGATPAASISYTTAKLPEAADSAKINWVSEAKPSKAIVTIKCAAGDIYDVQSYDLTSKHVDATYAADNNTFNLSNFKAGYTVYSAEIALPEGVTEITSTLTPETIAADSNGVCYDKKTGKYSVVKAIADEVAFTTAAALTDGFAAADDAGKWTVTDSTSGTSKAYVATAVSAVEIAHSKKSPNQQKAYTIAYGDNKTLTVNWTGTELAHKYAVDFFEIKATDAKALVKTVIPHLVCSDCGQHVEAADLDFALDGDGLVKNAVEEFTVTTKDVTDVNGVTQSVAGVEICKVNLGSYIATGTVYSNDPTFKWDTAAWAGTPTCEATFVSADGKMKVTVPCKVTLTDAATSTWTATVEKANIPEGFSGKVLTDTKVINLHDGHAMVLEKVEKASTTKSGFAQYYCNNDGMTYKVAIAKNDMKVSPTSKSFKASAVKKKAQTVTIKVTNAKGKVSYSVAAKTKKAGVSVSSKGKVTVKKGTAKGTYKVTVTSKATDTYAKVTKTVTIKVK